MATKVQLEQTLETVRVELAEAKAQITALQTMLFESVSNTAAAATAVDEVFAPVKTGREITAETPVRKATLRDIYNAIRALPRKADGSPAYNDGRMHDCLKALVYENRVLLTDANRAALAGAPEPIQAWIAYYDQALQERIADGRITTMPLLVEQVA